MSGLGPVYIGRTDDVWNWPGVRWLVHVRGKPRLGFRYLNNAKRAATDLSGVTQWRRTDSGYYVPKGSE